MNLSDAADLAAKFEAAKAVAQDKLHTAWRETRDGPPVKDIPAVAEFLSAPDGLTLADVHGFVTNAIAYKPEAKGADYWQPVQETFKRCKGDCEDYALAYQAVGEACGLIRDWTIDVVRQKDSGAYHAILVIDDLTVLDNNSGGPVPLSAHRGVYELMFRLEPSERGI